MKDMSFPTKMTAEEQSLLNKYALVKKKKREMLQIKSNTPFAAESQGARMGSDQSPLKEFAEKTSLKPSTKTGQKDVQKTAAPLAAPKDAKEIAKQLIASGQLKINKSGENRTFKRAIVAPEKKPEPVSMMEIAKGADTSNQNTEEVKKTQYGNFVSSGWNKGENQSSDTDESRSRNLDMRKRQNNVLFVSGYGLNQDILENSFTRFGSVTDAHMDKDRGHGFVTFKSSEAAEKAVAAMHGELVQGVTLKVTFARKRPFNDNRHNWRASNYDRRDQDHFRQRNGGRKEPVADDSNERTEDSLSDMNDQSKASEPGGRRQASRLVQSKPQTNTSNGGDTPTLTPSNEKRPKRELLTYQTNDDEFDF